MAPSRYDELHDQFHAILTTKGGTRYERLAAIVFKVLDKSNTVIHDLKLAGTSEVKHQIDVTVEREGKRRHLLVECKDFDVSGDKVGLGIVRDFFAVVEDTKPDEAVILTCNDFTSEAAKYAKAKGIKLAVMRVFEAKDWEGRIREIVLTLHLSMPSRPRASLKLPASSQAKLVADLTAAGLGATGIEPEAPVFVVENGTRTQFSEFVTAKANAHEAGEAGPVVLDYSPAGLGLEVEQRGPIPIDGLVIEFSVHRMEQVVNAVAEGIASLLVSGLGMADMVVFDKDLAKFRIIEDTGEVVPA
jgi:hypothetical protein